MCRLFGLPTGAAPVTATFWLLDAPESLRAPSHREPDETGLGGVDAPGRRLALLTSEMAGNGGAVGAGITAAVQWVAANLPVLALNFVLVTDSELWALRYPETHELHLLERRPAESLEQESSHGTRIRSPHAAERPTVVVASEVMDADPAWRPLSSGELV